MNELVLALFLVASYLRTPIGMLFLSMALTMLLELICRRVRPEMSKEALSMRFVIFCSLIAGFSPGAFRA